MDMGIPVQWCKQYIMMTEFICDLINTYFVICCQGAIFFRWKSKWYQSWDHSTFIQVSIQVPAWKRVKPHIYIAEDIHQVFTPQLTWNTWQSQGANLAVQVKTATDLFRQVEEKALGVAHGNSEDLDGMSHDRISGGLVADPCASCMSVAYWYYVYLWYLRPIITNNYWNNFRFELGVRVGKEWSGYVRIVPLHDETAGETLSKQKAARKRWRQQIKRQSFARLLLWVLHGKMQWYQYNV